MNFANLPPQLIQSVMQSLRQRQFAGNRASPFMNPPPAPAPMPSPLSPQSPVRAQLALPQFLLGGGTQQPSGNAPSGLRQPLPTQFANDPALGRPPLTGGKSGAGGGALSAPASPGLAPVDLSPPVNPNGVLAPQVFDNATKTLVPNTTENTAKVAQQQAENAIQTVQANPSLTKEEKASITTDLKAIQEASPKDLLTPATGVSNPGQITPTTFDFPQIPQQQAATEQQKAVLADPNLSRQEKIDQISQIVQQASDAGRATGQPFTLPPPEQPATTAAPPAPPAPPESFPFTQIANPNQAAPATGGKAGAGAGATVAPATPAPITQLAGGNASDLARRQQAWDAAASQLLKLGLPLPPRPTV